MSVHVEMNYPWGHTRRFNSYPEYFRKRFGARVQKVSVDAGLTCPNRDGSLGTGGCTFCNNDAFNPSYCSPDKTVTRQIEEGIAFHRVRYRRAKHFLAYFQTYSNTYASLAILQKLYEEALSVPGIAGLIIGTRPDCISEEILSYLEKRSSEFYISLEFGIESVRDDTLQHVNRGSTYRQAIEAFRNTHAHGLQTGAHFIIGLPGENRETILEDIPKINLLGMHSVKFHQLQIFRDTAMADDYLNNPAAFSFFKLEEYLDLMVEIAERLSPGIVIERIASEVPPRFQLNSGWGMIRYDEVQRRFEKKLEERQTWQGRLFMAPGSDAPFPQQTRASV